MKRITIAEMDWNGLLLVFQSQPFKFTPARSEHNIRKDFIKGKGFEWMEVWADFILECQILSQTSNLYLTVQGSGVGITPADSNSTSVYSRCRNKPRILNIYENLYIYSIYLTSMILGDENFPDSRYGANMTQDKARVKGKEKKQKYELIL